VLLKAIFMLYRLPESERVCSGICNWKNYDSAIILIRTSPKFPIDKLELELFKNNIYQLMGHNNILVGNIEKDYPHAEAIVMLLLIKL
jgi:hypothetical protein